jgi:raffinose/stachyose/melibiose transport system substrate-binding protein
MTAYILPENDDLDVLIKQLNAFIAETPSGYVIDSVMDAEGMAVLHAGLQEMIMGSKAPKQVGQTYEEWVAANDSNRK